MGSIATVSGTALVPGVSRNGRLYSRETIAKAVARAQDRIAEGARPLTMLTHHEAGDDSSRIVGKLTSLSLAEDGSVRFTAGLADTAPGRDIASLVSGDDPYLKGVSIRGAWLGKVRRERGPDGQPLETADDLELDGLDFTRKPGVLGAAIDDVRPAGAVAGESDSRHMIYESAPEVLVTITEETTEAETPPMSKRDSGLSGKGGPWADPGYQKDGKQRYQLSTKAQAKAAWGYVNQAENAKAYTAAQLKRIKGRIVKALKKFGVEVNAAEGYLVDPIGYVAESAEVAEYYGDGQNGSFCVELCNGPLRVTISSYCVDPADLGLIGKAAMDGACQALQAIDPDMDGDMDVPGADTEDADHDMPGESTATASGALAEAEPETPAATAGETDNPAPEPAADQPETEVPAVSESTPAVEATPAATDTTTPAAPTAELSDATMDRLAEKIGGVFATALGQLIPKAPAVAAESAPAATTPTQETAPSAAAAAPAGQATGQVTETEDQRIARLVEERLVAERQRMVESGGGPARKGLVQQVNEHTAPVNGQGLPEGWPDKPLNKYTREEWKQYVEPSITAAVLGDRA